MTTSILTPVVCSSYTSPSGQYTWFVSGTYYDTTSNFMGCDSLITIQLTVNNRTFSNTSIASCDSYVSPSGKYTWTQSGTYNDTLTNAVSCDSVITVTLTIDSSTAGNISATSCSMYASPSGNYIWTSTGIYYDTIMNNVGCDSIITINLTINDSRSTIAPTSCDNYTSPSGKYNWNTSGTYTDTITNSIGCDSIITINLTIDTVHTMVATANDTLMSLDTGASYQWLYCDSNYAIIPGETSIYYHVKSIGNYAVQLNKYSCIDTSACYNITVTSVNDRLIESAKKMIVFPNPTKGLFTINYPTKGEDPLYFIFNIEGEIIRKGFIDESLKKIDLTAVARGVYLLRVEEEVVKIVLD